MNVLVAGGAGYIGSHAVRALLKAHHRVIVVDDLSHGNRASVAAAGQGFSAQLSFIEANLLDPERLEKIVREEMVDAVMHFAAFIEVGESTANPGKYYSNNFCGSLNLLRAMQRAGVYRIVFSSTAAVYGNPATIPITEDQAPAPINPYGRSKMMVEMAIEDFAAAHGLGFAILRYFNVAGASADGDLGEAHHPETHLIPRILDAAGGEAKTVEIYGTDYPTGDGTCVRDYIHVEDVVAAHVLALNAIAPGSGEVFNIGSENGFTVRQVIDVCRDVTGSAITAVERPRRPGDPAILIASSAKIKQKLGWRPRYGDLRKMIADAWHWHQKRRRPHAVRSGT